MFAAQDVGNGHRESADNLIGRVDDVPTLLDRARLRHVGGHFLILNFAKTLRGTKRHFRAVRDGVKGGFSPVYV
jgi:hypothetical protein